MKKVLTGMSGGVDSSAAVFLLKQSGFEVAGVNLLMHREGTDSRESMSDEAKKAKAVCEKLGIDFYFFDFTEIFRHTVIEDFIKSYEQGATPNPCIVCNKHIKFGALLDKAESLGFDKIATGHYAQIEEENGRFLLKKGADITKDQSYVLYCLTQKQLSSTLFPLGAYTKKQIREIAESEGFVNAHQHDSQDICFVPSGNYAAYIEKVLGKKFPDGDFVTLDGKILGRHKGIIKYTIGQRKGLGLALPAPMYVYEKNVGENRVILTDEKSLFSDTLTADNVNFIPFDRLDRPMRVMAKVRYKQPEQFAVIEQTDSDRVCVRFEEKQRAIAKGQSVVFYDGEYVVGGGRIV